MEGAVAFISNGSALPLVWSSSAGIKSIPEHLKGFTFQVTASTSLQFPSGVTF